MAEYEHGSMNIDEQEKTFAGFLKTTKVMTIIIVVPVVIIMPPVTAIIIDILVEFAAFFGHFFLVFLPVFPGIIPMLLTIFPRLVPVIKLVLLQLFHRFLAVIADIILVGRIVLSTFLDLPVVFIAFSLTLDILLLRSLYPGCISLAGRPVLCLPVRSLLALDLVSL